MSACKQGPGRRHGPVRRARERARLRAIARGTRNDCARCVWRTDGEHAWPRARILLVPPYASSYSRVPVGDAARDVVYAASSAAARPPATRPTGRCRRTARTGFGTELRELLARSQIPQLRVRSRGSSRQPLSSRRVLQRLDQPCTEAARRGGRPGRATRGDYASRLTDTRLHPGCPVLARNPLRVA